LSVTLKFIPPCNPTTTKTAPVGAAWLHEPKLDGYRLQVVKAGRHVRLYSRNGHDWTSRLPVLVEALKSIPCRSAIIDAELCHPGAGGAPDFRKLMTQAADDRLPHPFGRRLAVLDGHGFDRRAQTVGNADAERIGKAR
jgi:ATP-dependent DNA ligase